MPQKPMTPAFVFHLVLHSLALGLSVYVVATAAVELNGEPSPEYRIPGWNIAFGVYGSTVALLGLANAFTAWRFKALTAVYTGLGWGGFFIVIGLMIFAGQIPKDVKESNSSLIVKRLAGGDNWERAVERFNKQQICREVLSNPSQEPANGSIQKYCCRAPARCAFQVRNGTYWEVSPNDKECKIWIQKAGEVCFECQTCKFGYIRTLHHVLLLLLLYCVGMFFCIGIAQLCEECIGKTPTAAATTTA